VGRRRATEAAALEQAAYHHPQSHPCPFADGSGVTHAAQFGQGGSSNSAARDGTRNTCCDVAGRCGSKG
jgi:hypothetical protein